MEIDLVRPGLQFYAEPIRTPGVQRLEATASTYGILDFEDKPKRGELYVVCRDRSVQSVWHPERSIGWVLLEAGDQWFYCVTQANHKPKPCMVSYHATSEDPPDGNGTIGGFWRGPYKLPDTPQKAEVIEQSLDEGEPEVGSRAPKKAPRPETNVQLDTIARNLNPELAAAAAFVGDSEQTAALAQFAEGKMSCAEMRMFCG